MLILSIETSCDETAISLMRADGDFPNATYTLLGNALFSQIEIHREYGGVFPALAKREHAKTIVPMFEKALESADLPKTILEILPEQKDAVKTLLEREEGLCTQLFEFVETTPLPQIDLIAVTSGPGLEPALWVGVNFAKALSILMGTPMVGVNHMEGHVLSSIFTGERLAELSFPALSLLISGGHTELVLMRDWSTYELVGQTRDDAIGEAFDKVARMLGLPYPGGPEVSKLAREAREKNLPPFAKLPRPMLDADNFDFSFSGLKTAVRYAIKDTELSDTQKKQIARDFEDAVTEVILTKSFNALDEYGASSLILGGGVTANTFIRNAFEEKVRTERSDISLYLPDPKLSTDNAIMIALAGHARASEKLVTNDHIKAKGNRSLSES